MVMEAIVIGGILALLAGAGTLTVTVYRLKGVVENGLTDKVDHIEERVDQIYDHLLSGE